MALNVCLRQLQISIHSGLKSRRNILRLPQKHWKGCFHFQHPIFVKQGFCSDSNRNEIAEETGHKQHTSGVTVSHHPQMRPSSCRKTSSGLPLILHYGKLYNYFIMYYNVIIIELKCTINVIMAWIILKPSSLSRSVENCLPQNQSLAPKRLGTAVLEH